MKAIIVDDEPHVIEMLHRQLTRHCPDLHIVAMCNSGLKGLKKIMQLKPDLAFLDIEMPDLTGLEMLEMLMPHKLLMDVIFVTAHSEYAVEAFKLSATHYILKPVNTEDLVEAVQRVRQKRSNGNPGTTHSQVETLYAKFYPDLIGIPLPQHKGQGREFLPTSDIMYLQASGNDTSFFLKAGGKRSNIHGTLKEWEEKLRRHGFLRIHRSFVINPIHVSRQYKASGGYLEMCDGRTINIGDQYKADFQSVFG